MELENERHVRIFVDADACPVIKIVERVAEKYRLPITLLYDTNHVLESAYSTVKVGALGLMQWIMP